MRTGLDWVLLKKFPGAVPYGVVVNKILGGAKNLFFRDYVRTETTIGVTFFWDAAKQEFELNGTTTSTGDLRLVTPMKLSWVPGEKYTVSVYHVSGSATVGPGSGTTTYSWSIFSSDHQKYIRSGNLASATFPEVFTFTGTAFEAAAYVFYLQSWRPGTVFDKYRVRVQVEKGEKSTGWKPYRG